MSSRYPALTIPLILASLLLGTPQHGVAGEPVQVIAVHALRYQDFDRGVAACQVFGEVKNVGLRVIAAVTLSIELLDASGRVVHKETLRFQPRIARPGNAMGDLRPIRPGEFGEISAAPSACPAQWLEGRIRYHLGPVTFSE